MMRGSARIFISYAHESDDHRERVLQLSNRLRIDGFDSQIDQYDEDKAVRWPQWMVRQLTAADFVLVAASPLYARRVDGDEAPGIGAGAKWEGAIITQALYDGGGENSKFIPVIFSRLDELHIPTVLRGDTRYLVDDETGYERLYRRLTDQPRVVKPAIGVQRILPVGSSKLAAPERATETDVVAWTGEPATDRVSKLVDEVRSDPVVSHVFRMKVGLLTPDECSSLADLLVSVPDDENVIIALAVLADVVPARVRTIAESALETAVFNRSLAMKARVMREFPSEILARADVHLRAVFFSEIVGIMRRNQYDEVNVITPAVVRVQAAIPKQIWAAYVRALKAQARSRAFRGGPAAVRALQKLAAAGE